MPCEIHARGSRTCDTCRNNQIKQMGVDADQLEEMKHALGLNYSKKPYRNQFYTESDDKGWNELVEKGLAKKGRGWDEGYSYFKLNVEGVRMVYKKKLTPDETEQLRV